MIRVFPSGRHIRRTPLSYPALAPLFADTIARVDRPGAADLLVFAHVLDLQEAPRALIADWRARPCPVAILSEEPFWDTIWGRRPTARHILVETRWGEVPAVQINHATSDLFRFAQIPYYLLTNPRFATLYRARFARLAGRTARQWRDHFASRPVDVSFLFERRPERYHDVAWPEAGLVGLCAWRTDLALACTGPRVERLGQSWQGGPTRFDLRNWYLDKMVRMTGRARILGAIENTHHPDYITEKLFDAFACGARPLYWAAPGHRIHDLGLPEGAWTNLHGLSPEAAADRVAALREDADFIASWQAALRHLAQVFAPAAILAERARLARALPRELERALAEPWAPAP